MGRQKERAVRPKKTEGRAGFVRYSPSTPIPDGSTELMRLISNSGFDFQNRLGPNASRSTSPSMGLPIHSPEEPVHLGDYLRIVSGHWRVVLSMAVAGCVLAILISWLQTPLFRARTSIEVESVN